MPDIGATPGHKETGQRIEADAQIRWAPIKPGEPVISHKHSKGHFTIVLGDVTMRTPHGDFRIVNDWFYVPAELEHSLHANSPSKYFCCGPKGF